MPWDGKKYEKYLFWIIQLAGLATITLVGNYVRLKLDSDYVRNDSLPSHIDSALKPFTKSIEGIEHSIKEHVGNIDLHMSYQTRQELFFTRREGESLKVDSQRIETALLGRLSSIEQTQKQILLEIRKP